MMDLRLPVGIFFVILGVLLETVASAQAQLTSVPVNTYAGGAILVFGAALLLLARRAKRL